MNNEAIKQGIGYATAKRQPKLIRFPTHGDKTRGFLSVAENDNLPFAVKGLRILTLTSYTLDVTHNFHTEQILLSMKGQVEFEMNGLTSDKYRLVSNDPHLGIYIPALTRGRLSFSSDAVVLQLVSETMELF